MALIRFSSQECQGGNKRLSSSQIIFSVLFLYGVCQHVGCMHEAAVYLCFLQFEINFKSAISIDLWETVISLILGHPVSSPE